MSTFWYFECGINYIKWGTASYNEKVEAPFPGILYNDLALYRLCTKQIRCKSTLWIIFTGHISEREQRLWKDFWKSYYDGRWELSLALYITWLRTYLLSICDLLTTVIFQSDVHVLDVFRLHSIPWKLLSWIISNNSSKYWVMLAGLLIMMIVKILGYKFL